MDQPNPLTAQILDLILTNLNKVDQANDYSNSNVEFAIGMPLTERPLDLAWGFSPVEAATQEQLIDSIIVGAGLIRQSGALDGSTDFTSFDFSTVLEQASGNTNAIGIIKNSVAETGVARSASTNTLQLATSASSLNAFYEGWIVQIIGGTGASSQVSTVQNYIGSTKTATLSSAWNYSLDNTSVYLIIPPQISGIKAYAFGSVFLYPDSTLEAVLTPNMPGYATLLVAQDYNIDTAIKMYAAGVIATPITNPSYDNFLELFKFVLDVQSIDPNDVSRNVVRSYLINTRKPRGFGGFSEEVMAAALIPGLINSKQRINSMITLTRNDFKDLVKQWVLLNGWSPNFISYWQSNLNQMPSGLQQYLFDNFGIIL